MVAQFSALVFNTDNYLVNLEISPNKSKTENKHEVPVSEPLIRANEVFKYLILVISEYHNIFLIKFPVKNTLTFPN